MSLPMYIYKKKTICGIDNHNDNLGFFLQFSHFLYLKKFSISVCNHYLQTI